MNLTNRLREPFVGPCSTTPAYSYVQRLQQNKIEETNTAQECDTDLVQQCGTHWRYYTWASGDIYH